MGPQTSVTVPQGGLSYLDSFRGSEDSAPHLLPEELDYCLQTWREQNLHPGRVTGCIRKGHIKGRRSDVRGSPTVVLGVVQCNWRKWFFWKNEGQWLPMENKRCSLLHLSHYLHLYWRSGFMLFLSGCDSMYFPLLTFFFLTWPYHVEYLCCNLAVFNFVLSSLFAPLLVGDEIEWTFSVPECSHSFTQ